MIQLFTVDLTVSVIIVHPLHFLILHQNNFPDFTALHLFSPLINIRAPVNFYTPKWVENVFNNRLALEFWKHLVFGLLSYDLELEILGDNVIIILVQNLNSGVITLYLPLLKLIHMVKNYFESSCFTIYNQKCQVSWWFFSL